MSITFKKSSLKIIKNNPLLEKFQKKRSISHIGYLSRIGFDKKRFLVNAACKFFS
ncbi:MAG: hypothetical protein ACOVOR_05470 [Rhabdochlamydiaceae bacterium]